MSAGPDRVKSPEELAILQRLREACARLPETTEAVDGFGHTSFRVRDRPFAMMGSTRLHLAIKADHATQDVLVRTGQWEKTPFIGRHGWVSVVDFDALDWAEIEELLTEGWQRTAPKRLVRQWQDGEA
jgi:predicted DNA-binding protein (MmcQ/YjbR family)